MSKEKNDWQINKKITVSNLIVTAGFIISVIWWASTVETHIAVAENKGIAQEKTNDKLEAYLIRIERKVDRLKK